MPDSGCSPFATWQRESKFAYSQWLTATIVVPHRSLCRGIEALPVQTIKKLFRRLGPGLITGAADDDPSGIATYSQAGSQFRFGLVWTLFLTTPLMIGIQMLSARIGWVTGEGLAANIDKMCPRWLTTALVGLLVIANTINIAADIGAMAPGDHRVNASLVVFPRGYIAEGLRIHGDSRFRHHDQSLPILLAGSAAYAVSELYGWKSGLSHGFRQAKGFYLIIIAATGIGTLMGYFELDPMKALVWSAIVNGVISVPIMAVLMWIGQSQRLMGKYTISARHRFFGWAATLVMTAAVALMLLTGI